MTASKLRTIAVFLKTLTKVRGSTLFSQGEPASGFYLVMSGEYKLYKNIIRQIPIFEEKAELILKDPFGEIKRNCKHHFKNMAPLVKTQQVVNVLKN